MSASRIQMLVGVAVVVLATLAIAIFSSAQADTYSYDALGRLIAVTYSDGSSISYTYDSAGNRTAITQTAAP